MVYGWFNIIWRVCWFEESHCSPALLKGSYLFHRTSCSNFCLKSTVLNVRKHLRPFNFNFTISQQQLRLFIRYSKFFNRAIAHCTWKKKVGSSYAFFQRCDNYLYRILAAIHSFNGIVHFSDVKILPMQLSFNLFLNTSYRETNFLSKQLYFQNSTDYIEIRTAIWSLYFFTERSF